MKAKRAATAAVLQISFSLQEVVLPSVAQTWAHSFLWVDTEQGGDSTNNIPIHRGRTRVLTNLICCCDPISRPNRKHHHSLLLEFHELNLISFSMTFLSRLDNTAAFNSLWGVDNLFTGSVLCRNKSTAVVTFVKLLSDVGCKTIGEITSVAKDEQPWLPKWVWCRKQRSKLRYSR